MPPLTNAQTRDVESVLHPVTNLAQHRIDGPLVIERGEGIHVYDNEGKRYVDGLAGLWCVGLGFGNEEMADTAREHMSRLSYNHLFGGRSNENNIELAEKIKELLPTPMAQVFFACSGSEANDTQIKLAWYKANARGETGRKKILARRERLPRRDGGRRKPDRHPPVFTRISTCRARDFFISPRRITGRKPRPERRRRSLPQGSPQSSRRRSSERDPRRSAPSSPNR